jgi:hypothetical protein
MIRLLPYAIELALVVFCLIDCVQSDERRIRNLPKWAWVVLIILLPIVGAIAWLVVGRPTRAGAGREAPRPPGKTTGLPTYERPPWRPTAPDDDPEFLRSLKKPNSEHEDLLRKWEEDLKRREDDLRSEGDKKPDES